MKIEINICHSPKKIKKTLLVDNDNIVSKGHVEMKNVTLCMKKIMKNHCKYLLWTKLLCDIFNKILIFSQVGKSLGGIVLKSPHSNPTFVLSPVTSLLVGICFRAWGRENGTLAHKCAVVFWGQSREALPKPQGLLGWRGNITSLFTKGFFHWASWGYGWKTGWDQLNMTDWNI